uniref:Vezatin n=1 Tax=Steinernema glaseri TaxID=37863 RepID=A0A1I7YFA4_9BILA
MFAILELNEIDWKWARLFKQSCVLKTMLLSIPLLLVRKWAAEHCLSLGLIIEQDQTLMEDSDFKKPSELKVWFWTCAVAPVFAYYFPYAFFLTFIAYVSLFMLTAFGFCLLAKCCTRLDRAVVNFIHLMKLTDNSVFVLDKQTPIMLVMKQERLKLLSILRETYNCCESLSEKLVVTRREHNMLWSSVLHEEAAALVGRGNAPLEQFIDFNSLKTLRTIVFLSTSQFLALSIRRLTLCTCSSDEASERKACLCSGNGSLSVLIWVKCHFLRVLYTFKLAARLLVLEWNCPNGQERKSKPAVPDMLTTSDALFLKAKVHVFIAADKIQLATSLNDVPVEVLLSLKEVVSILESRANNTEPQTVAAGKDVEPTQQFVSKDNREAVADDTSDDRQNRIIPDYEIFEGKRQEEELQHDSAVCFDDDVPEVTPATVDVMHELSGAIAGHAAKHAERIRKARHLAGHVDDDQAVDSDTNSETASVLSDEESDAGKLDVEQQKIFAPSLLEEIMSSAAFTRRPMNQETTFGSDDDA